MKSILLLVLTVISLNVLSACSSANGSGTNSTSGVSNVPRGLTPINTQDSGAAAGSRLSAPINTYR